MHVNVNSGYTCTVIFTKSPAVLSELAVADCGIVSRDETEFDEIGSVRVPL